MSSDWISLKKVCELFGLSARTIKDHCRDGKYTYRIDRKGHKTDYFIFFDSLPDYIKRKYLGIRNPHLKKYSDAQEWAKAQADIYSPILTQCKEYIGKDLEKFVYEWNCKKDFKISYPNIIKMRRRFKQDGIDGLLARYGHKYKRVEISKTLMEYFKHLYLKEGGPSLQSCWDITFGYAKKENPNLEKEDFPSSATFKRRLEQAIGVESVYLARYGQAAWNKKYGTSIERDYWNVTCGQVWVSDHAQIDVACLSDDGDVVFPWVTAWRDYKSGKWLGWTLQCGSPNSDRIFQTFYYAAKNYGLPKEVIIDNGKDYRCKDFAGGRVSKINIGTNKGKTTSMLSELNVEVHFALPYNAQTKPIERDFLKIKELLSKHCRGYRGGNVVERPEKLAKEIKEGKIIPFEKFKLVFDDFITNVLNKRPSQGKNLKGLSPDELFNQEFKEKIVTSPDALKLFCSRTSRNYTIGRNGIKDREHGITYWADWMIRQTGLKVYLRRDVQNYKEAWAFRADNEEFVGKVKAVRAVAALHANEVSREEFKEALEIKKRHLKTAKSYIKQTMEIPIEEIVENYKRAYKSLDKSATPNPKITKIANTKMDKAIRKNKDMEAAKQVDLSMFLDDTNVKKEEPLYLFETDKILDEEYAKLKGAANGY